MEINCEFKDYSIINIYECVVHKAEITKPGQVIKAFKGDHVPGFSNTDVRHLKFFYEPKMKYFPRDLHKHFPNLTDVTIFGCGIKAISKRDLRGLENLETFWIHSCQLTSLPNNLFTHMPKLKDVSFINNQIESASSNLLQPFIGRSVISVNLRGNKNIDVRYNPTYTDYNTHQSLEELMKTIDEKCSKPIKSKVIESEDFNEGIKKLWISGKFSDFKIVSGDKEFKVHRSILAMRSPVMAEIFEDHKEATELQINDFSPIAVESMLHFIYTNEVLHEDIAIEIFSVARKYNVEELKFAVDEIIFDNLNESNAYETFLFAHKNVLEDLKKIAFKVIAKKFPDHLSESLMEDPIKLKKLIDNRREYENLLVEQQRLSL